MNRFRLTLLALVSASLACQTLMGAPQTPPTPTASVSPRPASPTPRAVPTLTPDLAPTATSISPVIEAPVYNEHGVRLCAYVPGVSVPAQMPAEVVEPPLPTPYPSPEPPSNTSVDAETTARQLRVYRDLWQTVNDVYVYPDFAGRDWQAIGDRYEGLIQLGLSDESFYYAMRSMIFELGDEHSSFQDPADVAEEESRLAGENDYVGVGILVSAVPQSDRAVIISVFPGSPAAEAGLRSHDVILQVDGLPILDETGDIRSERIRGPEDTPVTLRLLHPGGDPFDLTLTRRRITGSLPIDYCLVPETRIGYLFFPSFEDETMPAQVRAALEAMTADGPLAGLILDNRQNGGGSSSVAHPILGLFSQGLQGYFVSRDDRDPLDVRSEDVGGSQTVPLVVLVDVDTVSYGEIVSGVLRVSGRATLVGQTTYGNVERLWGYDFEDGSRAWIASETFEPLGEANGIWEETGIIPDVHVPTRWDLFTEATDPALAAAVELLQP
jgi:C-terminal peptidase prc